MKTYFLQDLPLQELTVQDIDGLNFHSTPGALRRAIAVNKSFTEPASDDVPEITYYQEEPNGIEYSAHVIDTDVLRYLLKASIA